MRKRMSNVGTALFLAFAAGACGDGQPTPTSPSTAPPSTTPPPSAGPTITRIDIAGPGTVPPGETAQFTATASFSDGSTRDVTGEAGWSSFNLPVLSISTSGLATAHQTGEASILATFRGTRSGQRGVIVLHVGTYKVGGLVTEDGGVPLAGARVEVVGGPVAGLSSVTRSGGAYSLLGVPADTQLRVSKEGYATEVRTFRLTDNGRIDFHMAPLVSRADVSGSYTLTISAAAGCRSVLAEELRTQSYPAVLTQHGARLIATLEGAGFVADGGRTYSRFEGAVEPSRVWLEMRGSDFFEEDPLGDSFPSDFFSDVFVQLTPSTFVAVWGVAVTTVSAAGLSGTLNGSIETLQWLGGGGSPRPHPKSNWRPLGSCRSTDHQFVLAR